MIDLYIIILEKKSKSNYLSSDQKIIQSKKNREKESHPPPSHPIFPAHNPKAVKSIS